MRTENIAENRARPLLTLSTEDHRRLLALAHAAQSNMPELAGELADELERARVLAEGERAHDAVRMHSEVEYRDDATGAVRTVTLVYPDEADISLGKVSVMTPIGTALIGLPTGQSMTWETRSGETRQLTVLAVRDGDRS